MTTETATTAQNALSAQVMYGMAASSTKKGAYDLNRMTDVGKGNGFLGGRWALETVKTGKRRELEAEMERLNCELAEARKVERRALGLEVFGE